MGAVWDGPLAAQRLARGPRLRRGEPGRGGSPQPPLGPLRGDTPGAAAEWGFSGWGFPAVFGGLSRTNGVGPTPPPAWGAVPAQPARWLCRGLAAATGATPQEISSPWATLGRVPAGTALPAARLADAGLAPGCGASACLVGHQFILI